MSYLISALYLVLPLIFVLGTAVVLHEFGHFIVAKLLKIRVETFSVGFGTRLFGRRWGTTDYRLSLIPLGGYVKLGGDESNAPIEGEGIEDIPARERFDLRPRWQKFLVMVAGPTMNIITALAVAFGSGLISGVPKDVSSPVISRVKEGGESAKAGLQAGDKIVSFNETSNPTWERIRNDASLNPDHPMQMIVERNSQRIPLTIKPIKVTEDGESVGELDFVPDYGDVPVTIDSVVPDSGAAAAGLQAGDILLAINGQEVRGEQEVHDFILEHKSEPLRLRLDRDGKQIETTANVRRLADGKEQLGINYSTEIPHERVGLAATAAYALHRNIEILRLTGTAIGQIFTHQRSASESFSGPIGIARAASTAAIRFGLSGLIMMLGFLSLNLGVVNLLPIPVLDGGAIFLLFVEAILGWVGLKLSMTIRERIQQVGFVVLLLLMGFVITNDVIKMVSPRHSSSDDKPAVTKQEK